MGDSLRTTGGLAAAFNKYTGGEISPYLRAAVMATGGAGLGYLGGAIGEHLFPGRDLKGMGLKAGLLAGLLPTAYSQLRAKPMARAITQQQNASTPEELAIADRNYRDSTISGQLHNVSNWMRGGTKQSSATGFGGLMPITQTDPDFFKRTLPPASMMAQNVMLANQFGGLSSSAAMQTAGMMNQASRGNLLSPLSPAGLARAAVGYGVGNLAARAAGAMAGAMFGKFTPTQMSNLAHGSGVMNSALQLYGNLLR